MRRRFVISAFAVVAFIIVVAIILVMNLKNENMQEGYADRGTKELPWVSFICSQQKTNQLQGYSSKADSIANADTILPNGSGSVFISFSDGDTISKVKVCLESLDRTRLLDEKEVNLITKASGVTAEYGLSVMTEQGKYYYFTVEVYTLDKKVGYYTTKLFVTSEEDIEDKQDLISLAGDFSSATIQKREDYLAEYLKYDSEKAGTDLSYVNLSSARSLVMWAGLSPKVAEKVLNIYEWSDDQISIALSYRAVSTVENETNDYYVKEDFCVRERDGKYFVLNYERHVRQIFDGRADEMGNTSILLGIQSLSDMEAVNSGGDDIFFVADGTLWHYRGKDNVLTDVYGTPEGAPVFDYEYELHMLGVISGRLYFTALGYVGTGDKEGENAFALYEYNPDNRVVSAKLYVTLAGTFEEIKDNNARISYISEDRLYTVDLGGSLYSLDLSGNDIICLVGSMNEYSVCLNKDRTMASWKTEGDEDTISVMNLESGKIQTVNREGEKLENLGFIGNDVVYGVESSYVWDKDGFARTRLYDCIYILDENLDVKVEYKKNDKIYEPSIVESNLVLKLCRLENGQWRADGSDSLTFAGLQLTADNSIIKITSSEKKREYYYITLPNNRNKTIAFSLVQAQYLTNPAGVLAGQGKIERSYIVKGYGNELYRGDSLQEAIQTAYDNFGTVCTADGELIWNREPRALYLTIKLPKMKWTEEGHEEEMAAMSSLERGIDIFIHSGVLAGVITESKAESSQRNEAANVYDELVTVYGNRLLTFEKCDISAFLYYINLGHPVLVVVDEKTSYLITGYTTTNLVYYNPADRSSTTVTQEEAAEFFGAFDAHYACYY